MPAAGVIKSFLVSLGFKIDENSERSFIGGIANATKRAALLGATVKAASALIFASVVKTADSLASLNDTAERVGSTALELEKLGYIASQTGSSVEASTNSLERLSVIAGEAAQGIGRGASVFKELGLSAKKSDGSLKTTTQLLAEVGDKIRGLGTSQQMAVLQRLGIDRTMVRALTEDISELSNEYDLMYRIAGVNANEAAAAAADFMDEWGKLKQMSGMLYRAINIGFMMKFKGDIIRLRKLIMENADNIKRIISSVMSVIMRVASAIGQAFMRIIGWIIKAVKWFGDLDEGTQNLIFTIGALALAWKVLNLKFLATPLGALVAGLTALFLIVDDLLTYIEGGESYFDWGKWTPEIEKLIAWFNRFKESAVGVFNQIVEKINEAKKWLLDFWNSIDGEKWSQEFQKIIDILGRLGSVIAEVFLVLFSIAIELVKGALLTLRDVIDALLPAVTTVFDGIVGVVEGLWDFLKAFLEFITAIFKGDFEGVFKSLAGAFDAFSKIVENGFKVIRGIAEGFLGVIGKVIGAIKEFLGLSREANNVSQNESAYSSGLGGVGEYARGLQEKNEAMQGSHLTPNPTMQQAIAGAVQNNSNVTINSNPTINVHGSGDPEATANLVVQKEENMFQRQSSHAASSYAPPRGRN